MANKIDKKATISGILQMLLTPVFIIVLGTLFSLVTGYKANDNLLFVRILVWIVNLVVSWVLVTSLLKIFFRKKVFFLSYKFIFFAYVLSVLLIWSIGMDENDYSYVTSAITLIAVVGAIWGIKIYRIKKGRPLKER